MKENDCDQYTFDFQIPEARTKNDHNKNEHISSASDQNNHGKCENVFTLVDVRDKKRREELTRVYSAIVTRARHLFE
ncbi:MAG: hypothetical protein ACYDBH_21555 [Acidobacteriaceae bacterium]